MHWNATRTVQKVLSERGIAFKTFKDQVIFEKDEIVKQDGNLIRYLHLTVESGKKSLIAST